MDINSKKEKIKEAICNNLKKGMYKKDAAKMAGISEDTYLRWYKEDADFADQVEASILEYKQSLIQSVNTQAKKNGMLALKILQIRFPTEWRESTGACIVNNGKSGRVIILPSNGRDTITT